MFKKSLIKRIKDSILSLFISNKGNQLQTKREIITRICTSDLMTINDWGILMNVKCYHVYIQNGVGTNIPCDCTRENEHTQYKISARARLLLETDRLAFNNDILLQQLNVMNKAKSLGKLFIQNPCK